MQNKNYKDILAVNLDSFESLPLFFEGDSRVLKEIPGHSDLLISKLKPTIFSFVHGGPIELENIDSVRTELNAIFSETLHANGVQTSTLSTLKGFSLLSKQEVPPIEVVVKGAFIGSPKHIYKNMTSFATRSGKPLVVKGVHNPYVRFDWRNLLPDEDRCMPEGLADMFINTETAKKTALKAFGVLRESLQNVDFDLLDICFFMNTKGDVICAEVSNDDTTIVYTGNDQNLIELFSNRDKSVAVRKAEEIIKAL